VELPAQLLDLRVGLRRPGQLRELLHVDRDRRRGGADHPAVAQVQLVAAHPGAVLDEQPAAGADEVPAVAVGVEADDVGAEQAAQQLLAPRDAGEDVRRRPRRVQEEAGALVGPPLAHQLGTSSRW
jgi:hypothetical protein